MRGRRHRFAGAAIGAAMVAAVASAAPARANPAEIFGLGSRRAAQAGAGVASVDDMAATLVNPAGLAESRGKLVTLGAQGAVSNLTVDDRRLPLSDPAGGVLGLVVPAPLGGPLAGRIHLGVGMYVLPGGIARIVARFPDEPFYPYYQGRTERLVILPGVGVRATEHWDVGVAANVLAGLGGAIEAGEGGTREIDARVDEKVPSVARLIAGVAWTPAPAWRVGAVFRQRFEVPFATRANTEVAGEPIDLDLRATGQFSPMTVAIGGAWRPGPAVVSLDVAWARWSSYAGPFVAVKSELPLVGPLAAQLPTVPWRDTLGARLGVETVSDRGVIVRGGYGFETSPVPAEQPGVTNLLDGPKHIIAGGIGLSWRRRGGKRVRVDLHAQVQIVQPRHMTKRIATGAGGDPFDGLRDEVTDDPNDPATQGAQISNPGYPSIDSGGQVWSGGAAMEVEL